MLNISSMLFKELNRSDIRYVIWKGTNRFTDGLNGIGDVDILVHPDDKNKLRSVLKSLDFLNPASQKYSAHNSIEDFIGFDCETGMLIHLHTYYNIVFGKNNVNEYSFIPFETCFEISEKSSEINIQNPSIEYLILLCRIFTGAITDSEKIAENKSFLASKITSDSFITDTKNVGLTADEAKRLYSAVSDSDSLTGDFYDILGKLLKKNTELASLKYLIKKLHYVFLKRFCSDSAADFLKKSLKAQGLFIAFVGQDGAGKSTVTKDIISWLRWKLEARTFYLGSGEHYHSLQRIIIKKLRNKRIFRIPIAILAVSDQKRIARRAYKILKRADRFRQNGGIAVFDRFPQTVYPGINDSAKIRTNYLPKTNNKAAKLYMRAAAKKEEKYIEKAIRFSPDLLIKLMLSPEESLRRKPKEKIEFIEKKHEIIKELDFGAKNIYTVDVTQKYEREMIEIKNIIWDILVKYNPIGI